MNLVVLAKGINEMNAMSSFLLESPSLPGQNLDILSQTRLI